MNQPTALMSYPRHCEIYKARDGQYYIRLEKAERSETFEFYGPFQASKLALEYLQHSHSVGIDFYLDESGRRSVPMELNS